MAEKKEMKAKMTMTVKGSILAAALGLACVKRYEVQFQKDGRHHSGTNNLAQAKYYARSLANWNLAAQVYDRATQTIIFRARAYAEKNGSPAGTPSEQQREAYGLSGTVHAAL
jgi:hypothetical protein